jgi:acyl carrier protein
MTREEVFTEVQDIFRDIFDEDNLIISNETNSEQIEDWDSLNHIILVSTIEKKFKIKFALGELMTLKDVGSMVDLMLEKLEKQEN